MKLGMRFRGRGVFAGGMGIDAVEGDSSGEAGMTYILVVVGIIAFVLASMALTGFTVDEPAPAPAQVAVASPVAAAPVPQGPTPLQTRLMTALNLGRHFSVGDVYNACEMLQPAARMGCREDAPAVLFQDPMSFLGKLNLTPAEVEVMSLEDLALRCHEVGGAWNVGALAHADDYCARGATLAASVATGGSPSGNWPSQLTTVGGGAFRDFVLGGGAHNPRRR